MEEVVNNVIEYDLWPTKVMLIRFKVSKEFNDRLSSMALAQMAQLGALRPENHNIWDWGGPDFEQLKKMFLYGYTKYAQSHGKKLDFTGPENEKYIQDAWCQVYMNGTYGNIHAHQLGDFTAVYYSSAGLSGDGSGYVQLSDPRWMPDEFLYAENFDSQHCIYPEDGMMLIFPGYVWHLVPPYTGSFPRICFAGMFEWAIFNRVEANERKLRQRAERPQV